MPVRKVANWTEDRIAQLCAAIDAAADELSGNTWRNLDQACKIVHSHFPKDPDGDDAFEPQQIQDKVGKLASTEKINSTAFLREWKVRRLTCSFYRPYLKAGKNPEDDAGNSHNTSPSKAIKLRYTRPSHSPITPTDEAGREAEESPQPSDRESPQLSDSEKDAESDYSEPLKQQKPGPSGTSHPDANALKRSRETTEPASRNVRPRTFAQKTNLFTGDAWNNGWYDPPDDSGITNKFKKMLEALDRGARDFCEAYPLVRLTPSKMSEKAVALSELMIILPFSQSTQLGARLEVLFGDEACTTPVVLRCFAAAAVFHWVFMNFPDKPPTARMTATVRGMVDAVSAEYPDMRERFRNAEKLAHFKELEPKLPHEAERFQKHLLNVFLDLRVPPDPTCRVKAPSSAKTHGNFLARTELHFAWQEAVNEAFRLALEMRLRLARSFVSYHYRFPSVGDAYNDEWMESVHDDAVADPSGSKVLMCLRPGIQCFHHGERGLVVPALVLLEGYGPTWNGRMPGPH